MDSKTKVKCDNCQWEGPAEDMGGLLEDVDDLPDRLDPGCEVPAGECNRCGAFCYLVDKGTDSVAKYGSIATMEECINLALINTKYLHLILTNFTKDGRPFVPLMDHPVWKEVAITLKKSCDIVEYIKTKVSGVGVKMLDSNSYELHIED